ncbi:penicillin-binding transpeptidase domain-containing protein [Agromyces mediolanus]|uniref:penicillin-binding transpeptidase domain-containing protein n=1 Tax=Agromyces mediolanus TaxID=41986 RepID=UPI003616F458
MKEAQPGGTLQLTIDADLQWEVQRILAARVAEVGAEWGMVTVMNAKTGELIAVADVPTVDPNDPSSTDAEDRGSRSFSAPFEPGSTFKRSRRPRCSTRGRPTRRAASSRRTGSRRATRTSTTPTTTTTSGSP